MDFAVDAVSKFRSLEGGLLEDSIGSCAVSQCEASCRLEIPHRICSKVWTVVICLPLAAVQ